MNPNHTPLPMSLGSLTASSAEADADQARRFGGLARLYGGEAAEAIFDSHVAVVGIGGVGSWAAEALARSGVRYLTLIDMDHVAESNINRQIHALTQTVGQAKVLAMRDRIAGIHPGCQVRVVDDFVTTENWPGLLPGNVDGVIDAATLCRPRWPWPAGRWPGEDRWSWSARQAASGWPIGWISTTSPASRTTPCWHVCATCCAVITQPRRRGVPWD